jgi:ribosomal protein L11 methylase PrmA
MNLELPILQQLLARSDWLGYPWLILSGFLEKQWDKLRAQIPPAFHIRRRQTIDDWLTVTIARSVSA